MSFPISGSSEVLIEDKRATGGLREYAMNPTDGTYIRVRGINCPNFYMLLHRLMAFLMGVKNSTKLLPDQILMNANVAINHINGLKSDNSTENIEIVWHRENNGDRVKGQSHAQAQSHRRADDLVHAGRNILRSKGDIPSCLSCLNAGIQHNVITAALVHTPSAD